MKCIEDACRVYTTRAHVKSVVCGEINLPATCNEAVRADKAPPLLLGGVLLEEIEKKPRPGKHYRNYVIEMCTLRDLCCCIRPWQLDVTRLCARARYTVLSTEIFRAIIYYYFSTVSAD